MTYTMYDFLKELHNLLRNLCILLFCYLNYMPFQRCLITSEAGLKRTKTFLMKQWWLYFRSHPTDSWQTFLKITSVPTLVNGAHVCLSAYKNHGFFPERCVSASCGLSHPLLLAFPSSGWWFFGETVL